MNEPETSKFRSHMSRLGNITTEAIVKIWECRKSRTHERDDDEDDNDEDAEEERAPTRRRTILDFFGGPTRARGRRINPRRRNRRNTGHASALTRR